MNGNDNPRDVERRCLAKIKARQNKILAENPQLSPSAALHRALTELPNTYNNYCNARLALHQLAVRPLLLEDV